MESVPQALGNQRYAQLQAWLASPAQRVHNVIAVTAAEWWPDGVVPPTRKAAGRVAHGHRDHARSNRGRQHA